MIHLIGELVVHGPAELRMGMQNQGDGRIVFFAALIARLDAPVGAWENHFRHSLLFLNTARDKKVATES